MIALADVSVSFLIFVVMSPKRLRMDRMIVTLEEALWSVENKCSIAETADVSTSLSFTVYPMITLKWALLVTVTYNK